jgi:short-subunit dehydrogenase
MELAGTTALVTGATGGIGHAIARTLHARGAKLVISGRRVELLDGLRDELDGAPVVIPADLESADAAAELAAAAGEVDVLVANAALPSSGPIDEYTPEQLDRAIDVNLRSPLQLTRLLLPGMLERRRGQLVFISSLSGKVATAGSALYSATKFGLRGLALGMREDLHGSGVGVTVVNPGFVRDAGMFAESGGKLPSYVGTTTPERVAEAVATGIERNRAEIDVAPLSVRAGTRFAEIAPQMAASVQRRLGAADIAAKIAAGQRHKR